MDNKTRNKIYNEAVRIGEELLSLVKRDKKGMSWETMTIDNTKEREDPEYIIWRNGESIYSGNAGIVLFFLELYKQTRNDNYLEAAVEGMRWVVHYCRENPSDNYAFFTGRMGVSYALLKMHELTHDSHYLERALDIAEPCELFLQNTNTVDDLINGTSGTLLGLLQLHAATGEAWLLEKADLFLQRLVDRSHRGPEGLYWDFSSNNIRGLCSFSHGAAGIGFVFLEAGRYLQNEALYHIAEEAFCYERFFFNEENKNWPDFRKSIWVPKDYEEHTAAYIEGNTAFFTQPGFMNAWCHGAAGIGLSRLRAYEVVKKDVYAQEAKIALYKTEETDIIPDTEQNDIKKYQRSFTLCHGCCGNAEIFLEAYRAFMDESYLALAEKVALQALEVKKNKQRYMSGFVTVNGQEDTSLFMGNAGIGYFFLKLLEPFKVPSVLLPKIESSEDTKRAVANGSILKATPVDIRKRIVQRTFRRTNLLVEKLASCQAADYFERHGSNGVSEEQSYMNFVKQELIPSLSDIEQELVADILTLECEKYRIEQNIISSSLLNIKTIIQTERTVNLLKGLGDQDILQLNLAIEPDVRILLTGWDWNPNRESGCVDNLNIEKDVYTVLLKADADVKVLEDHLSSFSYAVLVAFQKNSLVPDAVQAVISNFEPASTEQEKSIQQAVVEQVRQAILAGFLIENSENMLKFREDLKKVKI